MTRLFVLLLLAAPLLGAEPILPDVNKLRADYKAAQAALADAQVKADKAKQAYLDAVKAIADAANEDGLNVKPKPPVDPVVTAKRVALLILEETEDAVAARGSFFADRKLADRIKAKQTIWRVADKDAKNSAGQTPADLVPYLKLAQTVTPEGIIWKQLPMLFVVDADSHAIIFQGACPKTAAELVSLLERVNP